MSSVGRRYGLSVSLLFRWRRQLDGSARPNPRTTEEGARAEARELREKVREFERLLGRKTLEVELLKQELTRAGPEPRRRPQRARQPAIEGPSSRSPIALARVCAGEGRAGKGEGLALRPEPSPGYGVCPLRR